MSKRAKRRKESCLNCGQTLGKNVSYCPSCGQKNQDNNINFWALVGEFFSNYFSYDSRFAHSVKPFFIQPGKLTSEFLKGRRVYYANPVRLYIIISIVHFFFFNLTVSDFETNMNWDNATFRSYQTDANEKARLDSILQVPGGFDQEVAREKSIEWTPVTDMEGYVIEQLVNAKKYSARDILDSLKVDDQPFTERIALRQAVRIQMAGGQTISTYIITNIPTMIFFILPIYALLLKLFYYNKGRYIVHLVHTLHLHSFVFFVGTIWWIFSLLDISLNGYVVLAVFLLFFFYVLFSSRRVYGDKWAILVIKTVAIGGIYSVILLFALIAEIIVSLILF